MNSTQPQTEDNPPSAAALEMAQKAVEEFHECFWWWNPEFRPKTREDVREIVLNLRKSGGRGAWARAQEIHQCH